MDVINRPTEDKAQRADALWRRYKEQNDQSAREQLLTEYLPLVKSVSGRLAVKFPANVDLDDLLGWGVLGLMDAVEKFDPNHGSKFESYASVRVRGAILDGIRNLDWAPRSLRQQSRQIIKAAESLGNALGRQPTEEELAEELDIDVEKLRESLREIDTSNILSLDLIISSEEESRLKASRRDPAGDEISASPREQAERKEKEELLAGAIASLSEQERAVVHLYYYEELTLKEIAQVMKVTESRICQINGSAMRNLRQALVRMPL